MGPVSSILAWIAFGVVAGIVTMILPFHRGYRGVLLNLAVGVAGALAGGFAGRLVGLYPHITSGMSLVVAAASGLFGLWTYHALWSRRQAQREHPSALPRK